MIWYKNKFGNSLESKNPICCNPTCLLQIRNHKKTQTHPTHLNRQTLIGLECNFRKIYIRVCIKSIKFISLFCDKRTDIYFTNHSLTNFSNTHCYNFLGHRYTVGENIVASTKIRNNCDSNIGIFSIPPFKLSLLVLFASFFVSVLCFFFDDSLSLKLSLFQLSR